MRSFASSAAGVGMRSSASFTAGVGVRSCASTIGGVGMRSFTSSAVGDSVRLFLFGDYRSPYTKGNSFVGSGVAESSNSSSSGSFGVSWLLL